MACLGLGEASLGAGDFFANFLCGTANLIIGSLENLGQGQLNVLGNTLNLGQPLHADFVDKGDQSVFIEPDSRLWKDSYRRQIPRRVGRAQVAEDIRLTQARVTVILQLNSEQPFVYDLAETIHDSRTVEVETGRRFVCEGIETGTAGKGILAKTETVPSHGFK